MYLLSSPQTVMNDSRVDMKLNICLEWKLNLSAKIKVTPSQFNFLEKRIQRRFCWFYVTTTTLNWILTWSNFAWTDLEVVGSL